MNKEFVKYEQALALKELGFDEMCFGGYDKEDGVLLVGYDTDAYEHFNRDFYIPAPLKQQVLRWFREQMFLIDFSSHDVDIYEFYIRWKSNKSVLSDIYNTYEESENACIDKLISICKQQDNGK
jgi:hypothetical protein